MVPQVRTGRSVRRRRDLISRRISRGRVSILVCWRTITVIIRLWRSADNPTMSSGIWDETATGRIGITRSGRWWGRSRRSVMRV